MRLRMSLSIRWWFDLMRAASVIREQFRPVEYPAVGVAGQ